MLVHWVVKSFSSELGNMRKTVEEKVDERVEWIIYWMQERKTGEQILTKREAEVTAESGM